MEPEFPHGMTSVYDTDRQRRSWGTGLPHFQSHFQENVSQDSTHTLPPIQSQRPSYDPGSSFEQQTRQQPSLYSTQGNPYPAYVSQAPHPAYGHALPHFSSSSSLLPSAAPAMPISHGYGTPTTSTFPQIRPMPAPAASQGHSIPHSYMPNPSFGFPNAGDDNDMGSRAHVVGSQGRRGILPSADGKPIAVGSNGSALAAKNTVIPQKDADGKFPCPHCSKTYLHGKHLKRHMLRHTGDRPYSCFLCNDTFSRSDILKRHFQKCSLRRGNPTGANHLTHSQSHLKRQGGKKSQPPAAIETNFPGVPLPGPHSASPIYHDAGMGMGVGSSSVQSQADGSKAFSDGASARGRPTFATTSSNFNRPNYHYVPGHNGPASLSSSGSSTPLTAKGTGNFHQNFTAELPHQRMSSYAEMSHRPGQAHVTGAPLESNGFDWPSYPQSKEGGENQVVHAEAGNVQAKIEGSEPRSRPGPLSEEQHDEFLLNLRGGYFKGKGPFGL